MRTNNYYSLRINRAYALLIGLCCFFATSLNAQGVVCDKGDTVFVTIGYEKYVMGTCNTRLIASIEDIGDTVTVKVYGIGPMEINGMAFSVFLKEGKFKLIDRSLGTTAPWGTLHKGGAIEISPLLKTGGIKFGMGLPTDATSGSNYLPAGTGNGTLSSVNGWDAIVVSLAAENTNKLEVNAGEWAHFFTYHLKKESSEPIQTDDFGIGTRMILGQAFLTPKLTNFSTAILYRNLSSSPPNYVKPELFSLRSPSSVQTEAADPIDCTTATLNGIFQRGALEPAANLLDGSGTYTGRIDWDTFSSKGFFYTTSNVTLNVKEFVDSLFINGASYAFPSSTEIAAGTFTRGSYTFSVNAIQETADNANLTNLTSNTQYYAWAFVRYAFQSSNSFPKIGEQISFTTRNIEAPVAETPQLFCPGARVSDLVATVAGGATLNWFSFGGTTALDPTITLSNNTSYFAKAIDGGCVSPTTEVTAILKSTSDESMISVTPPNAGFCGSGTATLTASSSLTGTVVFKWYSDSDSETPFHTGASYTTSSLTADTTFYISVSNNTYCEGDANTTGRKSVTVTAKPYSTPDDLVLTGKDTICSGQSTTLTATAVSGVTNPVYKWYSQPAGGTHFRTGASYTTSLLTADTTFYVSVSGDNYCEGERDSIKVIINCFTIKGTVFPAVSYDMPAIDTLFKITARLYRVPALTLLDPYRPINNGTALLYETTAVIYDGTDYIPGTPKNPGFSGNLNNPGYPIDWSSIGSQRDESQVDNTTLNGPGERPTAAIGLYSFSNIPSGDYLLALSRPGMVVRYAKITVVGDNDFCVDGTSYIDGVFYVQHRELVAGDVMGDREVSGQSVTEIYRRMGLGYLDSGYNAKYDINGDAQIDIGDVSLARGFQGFNNEGYKDTKKWLDEYPQP